LKELKKSRRRRKSKKASEGLHRSLARIHLLQEIGKGYFLGEHRGAFDGKAELVEAQSQIYCHLGEEGTGLEMKNGRKKREKVLISLVVQWLLLPVLSLARPSGMNYVGSVRGC
jgi:hypothetical protein